MARQIGLFRTFVYFNTRLSRPSLDMMELRRLPNDESGRFYIVKIDGDVAATAYRLDDESSEAPERWGVSGERKAFQGREEFSSLKVALEFINFHHRADTP